MSRRILPPLSSSLKQFLYTFALGTIEHLRTRLGNTRLCRFWGFLGVLCPKEEGTLKLEQEIMRPDAPAMPLILGLFNSMPLSVLEY